MLVLTLTDIFISIHTVLTAVLTSVHTVLVEVFDVGTSKGG